MQKNSSKIFYMFWWYSCTLLAGAEHLAVLVNRAHYIYISLSRGLTRYMLPCATLPKYGVQ